MIRVCVQADGTTEPEHNVTAEVKSFTPTGSVEQNSKLLILLFCFCLLALRHIKRSMAALQFGRHNHYTKRLEET